MTCPLCGKISPTRTSWMLATAALSAGLLVQTADNSFAQSSVLRSQPTNSWQVPAPRAYMAPSWPVNNTYAQQPARPSNLRRLPAPVASAPQSWPVNAAYTQASPQPTNSWDVPAPRADASRSWSVNAPYPQAFIQPTSASYPPVPQTHARPSWPGNYTDAQEHAQPTTTWQLPTLRTDAPPSWPVNYTNLQEGSRGGSRGSRGGSRRDSGADSGDTLESSGDPEGQGGPFISTRTFTFWNDDLVIEGEVEIPVLGRMNPAEHNSPLPRDRAYFIYKHYDNVLNNTIRDFSGNVLGQSNRGISQYLVGYERTFHDELSSLELRMPFFSTGSSQFNAGVTSNDPSIGNFALIAKRLVYRDDLTAVSAGYAVTMPTGDDTMFSIGGQTFNLQNDTAHLVPFLGMLKQSPDQCWFVMAFGGLDVPMRGNQIEFVDPIDGAQDLGRLTDQTLLYLDLTVGRWLYRNPCSEALLTGFAVQGELHYAGTLNDANSLQGTVSGVGWNTGFNFGNTQNRFDSTFAALVLHTELQNKTDIRVAGVFPMNDANNRFFDSEIFVSIIQRF